MMSKADMRFIVIVSSESVALYTSWEDCAISLYWTERRALLGWDKFMTGDGGEIEHALLIITSCHIAEHEAAAWTCIKQLLSQQRIKKQWMCMYVHVCTS